MVYKIVYLFAITNIKRLIFLMLCFSMHNPVGQEEKTGLARFPLAVLSNTLPSAKLAKGTGRDRTYPTHANTHENRTPGTQQNYPTKPHNRTCPEQHKKLIGRGAPHGKGVYQHSRRVQPFNWVYDISYFDSVTNSKGLQ